MRKFAVVTVSLLFLFAAGLAFGQAVQTQGPPPAQGPRPFAFRAVHYEVDAALSPADQILTAKAKVEFQAGTPSREVQVELHPDLKVAAVVQAAGKQVPFERDDANPLLLRVTLPEVVPAGQKVTLTFTYAGPLVNEENSPSKGVRLAWIGPEGAYLLLPARWFPLTAYPSNRYTAVFNLTVPQNFAVAGTGTSAAPSAAPAKSGGSTAGNAPAAATGPQILYTFRDDRMEDSGTFVAGNLQLNPANAEGLNISVYAPAALASSAQAYGPAAAQIVNFFSDYFGPLPQPNLTVAQLPDGTVAGFSAPGLLLISQRQWGPKPNTRMLANLAAEQWWGKQVMPETPADVWLTDGLARYCEAIYVENTAGKEGLNRTIEDFAIGALMYEDAAPIAQAARLQPFTADYRSVVVNKGAMVFHMLHALLGDDAFHALLREFYTAHAGKTARLEDFEKMAQAKAEQKAAAAPATATQTAPGAGGTTPSASISAAPLNLTSFFAQWLNSTGVPEFKVDYIVYRTQRGFKIVGKVHQDLDFFRIPVEVEVLTEGNPEFKTIEVVGTDSEFAVETFGRPKPGGILLDPHNYILKSSPKLRVRAAIARGEAFAEQGRYFDAIKQYQQALAVQKNNSLADFRTGEAFFYQKNYAAAANAFRDAVDGDLDPDYKWVEVWSHIYLGKIYDLNGDRTRAVNEYSKAKQTNDDTGGAQAEVDKYLQRPYKESSAS